MARRVIISVLAASAALIAVPVSAAEQGAANRSHPQASDERQPAKKAPWTATEPASNPKSQKAQKTARPATKVEPPVQKQKAPRAAVVAAPKVRPPHHAVRHAVVAPPPRERVTKVVHVEQVVQVQEVVQVQPVVSYVTQPVVRHVSPPFIEIIGPKPDYLTFDTAPRYFVKQRASYTSIPVAYTPAQAYVEDVATPVVSYVPVAASWKACQYGAYVNHAPYRCGAHHYRAPAYRPYGGYQSYYTGYTYGASPPAFDAVD